jgi:hypothetical protein
MCGALLCGFLMTDPTSQEDVREELRPARPHSYEYARLSEHGK